MADSLLAKLKVKPTPKIKESIEIKLKKPALDKEEVQIKTKIVDKTKKGLINREDFIAKIEEDIVVKSKFPSEKESKKLSKKESEKELELELEKGLEKEKIVEDPIKLKKRLKLEQSTEVPSGLKSEEGEEDEDKEKKSKSKKDTPDDPFKVKTKRLTTQPIGIALEGPTSQLYIGDEIVQNRLEPKSKPIMLRASSYYMNNREIFINFITSLLNPYKKAIIKDEKELSCANAHKDEFEALTHQKIVRDYINLYTPYRGLLLYHGLGSGKTCSSIGIAEGLKTDKKVIIMTPASLRMNYKEELKKCGDLLYKKNQFWEFINTKGNPELTKNLSFILSLSVDYINKHGGAWLVNMKKASNFETLSTQERLSLDAQIDEMIKGKYRFINYNGLRNSHLQNLTANDTINPFDNSIIVVDEAHNFVSRIVNKLKSKTGLALKLYELLMSAENAKIILLTGTPIINYPNEISILFNILRGYIKTYKFKLSINATQKVDLEFFNTIFKSAKGLYKLLDYIEYTPSSSTLTITQNPFGFISKHLKDLYEGVEFKNEEQLTTKQYIQLITKILEKK